MSIITYSPKCQSNHRVSWDIDGEELWFESEDVSLGRENEALLPALASLCALRGDKLRVNEPVDGELLDNLRRALAQFKSWWGTTEDVFEAEPERAETRANPLPRDAGLFFSRGVDSFYSLLRPSFRSDALIYVHGFDVPVDDLLRFQSFEPGFRAVAEETGRKPILVRTNFRKHHIGSKGWVRCHGGALATVGHLLGHAIGTVQISASYPFVYEEPWGTHWRLDPYWSSARVHFGHVGAHLWRREKLQILAREPLVRKYLHVCWEHRTSTGNCGKCEKCVRTMLTLAVAGELANFTAFPGANDLPARIGELDKIHARYIPVFASFLSSAELTADVRVAIDLLIGRSK